MVSPKETLLRNTFAAAGTNCSMEAEDESQSFVQTTLTIPQDKEKVTLLPQISRLRDRLLFNRQSSNGTTKNGNCLSKLICSKSCFLDMSVEPQKIFDMVDTGSIAEFLNILTLSPDSINIIDDVGKTLLHHAAEHGQAEMIELLIQRGCSDFLVTDHDGNTALHLAAMKDQKAAVEKLIAPRKNGVRPSFCVRNEQLETPLHIAVRHGSFTALECLLNVCDGGVNTPGWHGDTPLHVACCLNMLECATLLIAHGADPKVASFSGMTPVHCASRRASKAVLEYLLTSSGIAKEVLLGLVDDENSTPLHWAVNNGDLETVQILMKHGARLDAQMDDKSTPLHLACSQGLLAIVTEMFTSYPVDFKNIVELKDAQGMTCLHRATMFDHAKCIMYLLEKGSPINEEDNEGRTPLILASSRASWYAQARLLDAGANPFTSDHYGRNFLHYLISKGRSPELCSVTRQHLVSCSQLLNERDISGCTPLHYAAQNGSLRSSTGLLALGASVATKDKQEQSPLHFAARYGRINTVKRLLDNVSGFTLINDSDNRGWTALHLAAENGHSNVIQLLMSRGALIHRDFTGRTPLHLAAANNYHESVNVIAVHYAHLVDSVDKEGNTALHLAAANNASKAVMYLLSASASQMFNAAQQRPIDIAIQRKHYDTANAMVAHERWDEILTQPSAIYGWPVIGLIEHLPEVMMAALDRCVVKAQCHPFSKDFFIDFCFKLLEPPKAQLVDLIDSPAFDPNGPLLAMNSMVRHGRCNLLTHAVCSSYLNKKWASYGLYFHGLNVAVYATFLALLTYLICGGVECSLLPNLKQQTLDNVINNYNGDSPFNMYMHDQESVNNDTNITDRDYNMQVHRMEAWMKRPNREKASWTVIAVAVFTILSMFKEIAQMIHQRLKYFQEFVNYLEWVLYISATIFALGYFDTQEIYITWRTRWQLGACAIFFGWFNFMMYLQRFGMMGIYVVMFLGILKTLLRAMFVFTFLIVAFSLAFYVLLPISIYPDDADYYKQPNLRLDPSALRSPHLGFFASIMRITSMMLGDYDAMHNYIYPITEGTMPFPELTYVFIFMFIVTVSILLMNLMIGLAVGDIGKAQCGATLKRIGMQVQLHTGLERRLPKWFIEKVSVQKDKYYPNKSTGIFRKLWFIARDPAEAINDQTRYGTAGVFGLHDNIVGTELHKQRTKMKELQTKIEQQHDLLRLVVQKMEINEEADELAEGIQHPTGREKTGVDSQSVLKRRAWAGALRTKAKTMAAVAGFMGH